jgi:hypothetical protein
MSGKYRLLLAFWGALFLVSACIMLVSVRSFRQESEGALPPFPLPGLEIETEGAKPIEKPDEGVGEEDVGAQWSLVLATVSAFISAAGFMATTYFALRNDRRQAALTELEVQKLANEIERQRLEINQLRRAQESPKSTNQD